jgi:hypothetical protein
MTSESSLQIAIAGETYEYTEMYPGFRKTAELEGNTAALAEIDAQIAESRDHATAFEAALEAASALKATLSKAQKRFAALTKVEERHANHYQAILATVAAK